MSTNTTPTPQEGTSTMTPHPPNQPVPLDELDKWNRATYFIADSFDPLEPLRNVPALLRELESTLATLGQTPVTSKAAGGAIEYCIGGALALLDTACRFHTLYQHGIKPDLKHPANLPISALTDALDMFDNYVTETSTPLTESCLEGAQLAYNGFAAAFELYDFLEADMAAQTQNKENAK